MIGKITLPLYCITIALSAGLLFSVQPMFSKMILPALGGSAQVWSVAMVFFQCALLGGYTLAFLTNKYLPPVLQALALIAALGAWWFALPFSVSTHDMHVAGNPILAQLGMMLGAIGGPFLLLSTLAPILQRWFANAGSHRASDPYFLYSASNIGSLGVLLAYPFLIERLWPLHEQASGWAWAYAALVVLIAGCVMLVRPERMMAREHADEAVVAPRFADAARWTFLAFIPSSLLLGVTNFITTDIASTPLLWIIPLCLYLLSYIIAFADKKLFSPTYAAITQSILISAVVLFRIGIDIGRIELVLVHLALFFACALNGHFRLAALRPAAKHLGAFYLCIALGGALGGFFNALVAPVVFTQPWEYVAGLCLACVMGASVSKPSTNWKNYVPLAAALVLIGCCYWVESLSVSAATALAFLAIAPLALLWERPWHLAAITGLAFVLFPLHYAASHDANNRILFETRNFYGTSRVIENRVEQMRYYIHGTTIHGTQAMIKQHSLTPISYYSTFSALNDPIEYLRGQRRLDSMAVIGLGVGGMSCLLGKETHIDFYEIDPAVRDIALNGDYFTFLRDCPPSKDIIVGDGRLSIAGKDDASYDLIVVDAFSSDNIPMHLITDEAVSLYRKKLKPDGILLFHISNNYLELARPLSAIAKAQGMNGLWKTSESGNVPDSYMRYMLTEAFIITANESASEHLVFQEGWSVAEPLPGERPWTDQFANMLSVIRW